jgi:MFS family permease
VSEPRHAASERPATYREVLANREYRAVYTASAVSWLGDYMARAAVTALVFTTTGSVVLSVAAFAVGYLPGLTCGPFLAAMAERYTNRAVMVTCDLSRAGLIALVAIPHLPVGAVLVLLFLTTLLNAPFDASRSALMPRILSGDHYVVAVSLQNTTNTFAQLSGYVTGGALAPLYPHAAILVDAGSFVASALLIRNGTQRRDRLAPTGRQSLLRETAAGFKMVLTQPVLRAIAAVVMGAWTFAVVPEGLAAAWAGLLAHHPSDRGFDQALIMMSVPVGSIIGGVVVARWIPPRSRTRLIRPLSVLAPLALVPAMLNLSAVGVAILGCISGFAAGGLVPPANALFVQALPNTFRARGFGVMQFGFQLVQAAALFITGGLSDRLDLTKVVGWWSVAGVGVLLAVGLLWPSAATIEETVARVRLANTETTPDATGRHAAEATEDVPQQARDAAADDAPAITPIRSEASPPEIAADGIGQPAHWPEPPRDGTAPSESGERSTVHVRAVTSGDGAVTREMVTDVAAQNGHAGHAPRFEV